MNEVFADTFYFLALLNPKDSAHARAASVALGRPQLVTSRWILTEVGDALSAPVNRNLFLELLKTLEGSRDVTIVEFSEDLFRRAVRLFGDRRDKDWPLTDCTSFVIMEELDFRDALTADRHFVQAGFRPLLA
jgi:predicted nucleic acid-binding protein